MMAETKSSEGTKSSCVSALISCFNLGSKKKPSASPGPTPKPAVPYEPKPQSPTKSAGDSVSNDKAESISSKHAGTGNTDADSKHSRESTEAHVEAPSSDAQLVKYQPIIVTESAPVDLWHEALNKTHQDTKSWMGKFGIDRSSTIQVQELTTLVRQSEEIYQDASSGLKIGERNILWRDYANRVVAWVTMIGDVAIAFAPAPVSPAETSRVEQLTAIFGAADRILGIVRRGQIYESVYGLASANLTEPSKILLRDSLIELYRRSLDSLASTSNRLDGQVSWATQFLAALTDSSRAEPFLSDLTDAENDVSRCAEACVCEATERNLQLLQSLHSPLRRIDDRVTQLLNNFQEMKRQEREHAMDHISNVKVDYIHVAKKEMRTEGTCEWLVQHPRFLAWEEPSFSSILWLNGQVGAGKTFLTSKVVDRYRSRPGDALGSPENDEGFAHFYCDRGVAGRRDVKSILSSYMVQLSTVSRHRNRWHTKLLMFCRDVAASRRSLEISECKRFVRDMVNAYPRSILVLDGLDECEENSRSQIVRFFRDLVKESDRPVKIFISSRPEADILELMGTSTCIQISTADNEKDIEKYIDSRLSQLQWDQLEPLNTETDVKERLMQLPEGLSASYEEICSRQSEYAMEVLMRVAMWVKWAQPPLKTWPLLHAETPYYHMLLRMDTLSFVHYACQRRQISVVKTLLSRGADTNSTSGHTPLCYAAHGELDIVSTLLDSKADPNVMCLHGRDHMYYGADEVFYLLVEHDGPRHCIESAFIRDADVIFRLLLKHGADLSLLSANGTNALHIAAYRGAVKCSRILIEELGYDVNSSLGGDFGSTLGAAVVGGSRSMIKFLFEEAMVDPTALTSNPPRPGMARLSDHEHEVALLMILFERAWVSEYLLKHNYWTEEDLLRVGYLPEHLRGEQLICGTLYGPNVSNPRPGPGAKEVADHSKIQRDMALSNWKEASVEWAIENAWRLPTRKVRCVNDVAGPGQ
ncbi:uncharacterized protein CCOS01_01338 [Colletotrichum costaricense]|uniref:NACHT domain-containing protein n=1 Tax=Colletotrichum costaricense TaxID=1209916 RepID=A0AAI9ZAS5_9PEZI|nr:uncharacterized protein CCOS01_01338 [Colletotrichum costaricense]KAK1540024.1 hypothetical protein CCOS01_01338 [Colletotrichum costaricense]